MLSNGTMEFEFFDKQKYIFMTTPDDEREGRCRYIHRISVHPTIKVGGPSLGRCANTALPGMDQCYIHAPREAMAYAIRILDDKVWKLEKELHELKGNLGKQ